MGRGAGAGADPEMEDLDGMRGVLRGARPGAWISRRVALLPGITRSELI
jgi:hypothetical protein